MKRTPLLFALLAVLSACSTPATDCTSARFLPLDLSRGSQAVQDGDYERARRQLRVRAHYNPQAEYLLGLMYEEGIGIEADQATAASLYLHAAKAGDAKAQFRLAYLLWEGIGRSSTNFERYRARDVFSYASEELTRQAQAGDAEAQYMLGYLYGTGKAFPINREEATRWYLNAAEQEHAGAQHALGVYYKGNRRDDATALSWFRRAARNGYADSQFHLGDAYRWGVLGVAPDKVEAMTWYSLAAASGHAAAAYARDELIKKLTSGEVAAALARSARRCEIGPTGA